MAFAATAVVLVLGIVEGGLRLAGVRPYPVDLHLSARLGTLHQLVNGDPVVYTLKPNSTTEFSTQLGPVRYHINRAGLRGPEITVEKPPGVRRVLLLGDSVTFGFGTSYEETFASQLQTRLGAIGDADAPYRWQVLNMGVGGYNTYTERVFYETRGRLFQPDLVLLIVCPNDVDNPLFHFEYNNAAQLTTLPDEAIPNPAQFRRLLAERMERPSEEPSLVHDLARLSIRYSALAHLMASAARPARHSNRQWEACVQALAREDSPELAWFSSQVAALERAVTSDHAAFGVVLVPLRWQLADETGLSRAGRDNLARIFEKHSVAFLDTLHALRDEDPATELFFDACHLTPRGHDAVTATLIEWLGSNPDLWND